MDCRSFFFFFLFRGNLAPVLDIFELHEGSDNRSQPQTIATNGVLQVSFDSLIQCVRADCSQTYFSMG